MRHGFVKVECASLPIRVADCEYNAKLTADAVHAAAGRGAKILVLPELCLTGYTCSDLFFQQKLLNGALEGLAVVAEATRGKELLTFVGLPLGIGDKLYNCAAVLYDGTVIGVVPKTNLPNYSEFYELRQFAPAPQEGFEVRLLDRIVPFGTKLLFRNADMPEMTIACEICEDLWAPLPPSVGHALAGATIIVNLSASNETVGKGRYRRDLVVGQSARLVCGYVYCSASEDESTTDTVYSGHQIIAENGTLLTERRSMAAGTCASEVDVQRLIFDRRRMSSFQAAPSADYRVVEFAMKQVDTELTRKIGCNPFVPESSNERDARCQDILGIQSSGLRKRISHTRAKTALLGLSGGLDSTLALLVAARAMDELGRSRKDIIAVTMPCFGTTSRTKSNAVSLAKEMGVTFMDIPIADTVRSHFRDIGLDDEDRSVAYENGQARERTQVLMDLANMHNGLVVGTGDLSELALGWATYNGDHMSMYAVNAGVPKTLVRHIVSYYADVTDNVQIRNILLDILDTPVSPELLPPEEDGQIAQKTEDLVGPYELHDFYLYYAIRWGFTPEKVLRLAACAHGEKYFRATLIFWLKNFYRRFFSQQFKRSCLPDGPKVGTVTLSPRSDWRMPSDAVANLWLAEVERLEQE